MGYTMACRAALATVLTALLVPVPSVWPAAWAESLQGASSSMETAANWEDAERMEVAVGNAHRGPWRMNDSDFDFVDDPTVALSNDGHAAVAWADQARQDVYFQMVSPEGEARLDAPTNVSRSDGIFSWLPKAIVVPDDPSRVYLLWQDIVFSGGSHGGEIFFARSTDGGETFEDPINLSNSTAGAGKGRLTAERWDNGSLDLARGPEGRIYAAWTEYEGRLWLSSSDDDGESFFEPLHVWGDHDRPARAPALAVDSTGAVHLAWTPGEDPGADIHLATSRDEGRRFATPHRPAPGEGHADAPKIAVDSRDRLHLVYGESPGGPFEASHLRYVRLEANGDTLSEPREIAGPRAPVESVNFPHLAVDGGDRVHIVWETFPDRQRLPQGLGVTVSSDGGESFAPPREVPESGAAEHGFNGGLQGLLMRKLAVNEAGAAALVSSTFAPGTASRIWLWRAPPP